MIYSPCCSQGLGKPPRTDFIRLAYSALVEANSPKIREKPHKLCQLHVSPHVRRIKKRRKNEVFAQLPSAL